jgi:hypothetical protein
LTSRWAPLILGLAGSGCIDFIEPDIPELGAPATVQATLRLTDLGTAEVDVYVTPGLDSAGALRSLSDRPPEALGRRLEVDSIRRNGTRRYTESWLTGANVVAQPIRFRAPNITRVQAAPPAVEWVGVRRAGPDTIRLRPGEDLLLPVALGQGSGAPEPGIRQWFLRLAGSSGTFGLSADGTPPDTIYVPARWFPRDHELDVRLIFNQSSILRPPPGDYIGVINVDVRLFWTVRIAGPAATRSGS